MSARIVTIGDRVSALAEHLSGKEADRSSRLLEDLELDSLDRVQLALDLENAFGMEIPDEDVDNPKLGTVGGLIDYVEAKVWAAV